MPRIVALVLGACFVLAGCNPVTGQSAPPPPASTTPAPIDSPLPSPSPEPSPSESAAPTQPAVDSVPVPADTYAIVTATDLRVRSKPGVSDDSKKLEPLLQPGHIVLVLDGPVQASGYDWYLVQPIPSDMDPPRYLFGWIAAAGEYGEPWIGPASMDCPPLPETVEDVGKITNEAPAYFQITCFGAKEISFRARFGVVEGECENPGERSWGIDPTWLQPCTGNMFTLAPIDPSDSSAWFRPRWSPDVDTSLADDPMIPPDEWPIVEVTGMFDHPAAQTCRNQPAYDNPSQPEPDPAHTVLACRMEFVVTSLREVNG
jgi:hypothetical protein